MNCGKVTELENMSRALTVNFGDLHPFYQLLLQTSIMEIVLAQPSRKVVLLYARTNVKSFLGISISCQETIYN